MFKPQNYARAVSMARRYFAPAAIAGSGVYTSRGTKANRKSGFSYTGTRKRNFGSTGIVSNQFDVKTWYKKKNMPRRRKAGWKKFSRKVKAVVNKEIAPTIKLLREAGAFGTNTNRQNWGIALLYTADGSSAPNNDIAVCKLSVVGSGGNDFASNFRFESACLDLIMKNDTDTYNHGVPQNVDPQKIVVDLYHVVCRKDIPLSVAANIYAFINSTFSYSNDDQDTTDQGKIELTDIGAALFHNPLFCRFFKILKKQAIQLGPGQSVELQMRDPKNRKMYGLASEGLIAKKGWTKGFVYSIRGVPQTFGVIPQAFNTPAVHVSTGYTRSYVMRPLQQQTVTSGFQ